MSLSGTFSWFFQHITLVSSTIQWQWSELKVCPQLGTFDESSSKNLVWFAALVTELFMQTINTRFPIELPLDAVGQSKHLSRKINFMFSLWRSSQNIFAWNIIRIVSIGTTLMASMSPIFFFFENEWFEGARDGEDILLSARHYNKTDKHITSKYPFCRHKAQGSSRRIPKEAPVLQEKLVTQFILRSLRLTITERTQNVLNNFTAIQLWRSMRNAKVKLRWNENVERRRKKKEKQT